MLTTNYSEISDYVLVAVYTEDRTVATRDTDTSSTGSSSVVTSSTDSPPFYTAITEDSEIASNKYIDLLIFYAITFAFVSKTFILLSLAKEEGNNCCSIECNKIFIECTTNKIYKVETEYNDSKIYTLSYHFLYLSSTVHCYNL